MVCKNFSLEFLHDCQVETQSISATCCDLLRRMTGTVCFTCAKKLAPGIDPWGEHFFRDNQQQVRILT